MIIYKNIDLINLPKEIFKDVTGYWGIYQISNYGRVKSLSREIAIRGGFRKTKDKIIKQWITKMGQVYTTLHDEGKKVNILTSHLVAREFISKNWDSKKQWIIHKDKVEHNNRVENLIIESPSFSIKRDYDLKVKIGIVPFEGFGKHNHYEICQKKYAVVENEIIKQIRCRRCQKLKNIEEYYYHKKNKTHKYVCNECLNIVRNKRRLYKKKFKRTGCERQGT